MAFCTDQILSLATGIYQSIGSPSSQSVGFISGWITNSGNLGDLNNKLGTDFYLSGDMPCIVGGCYVFDGAEQSIYTLMYKSNYYEAQSLNVLASPTNAAWTNIKEGDTSISQNPAAISKAFLALNDQSNKFLRWAISDWKRDHANPYSVDSAPLNSWPTPN